MKTMKDYMKNMLRGKVEVITVMELRKRPGECLTQASLGKTFCIKRKGKIVAFLVPPGDADITHEVFPNGTAPTLALKALGEE